jgi:hypothetical protein
MAWKFDQPFQCLSDEQEQKEILALWEKEKHGGLWMANNKLPMPLVWLIGLIILTAFMITKPIWGQRPNAADYVEVIKAMDSAEVQRLETPEAKAKEAFRQGIANSTGRDPDDLARHPLTWNDLLNLAPQIREIQAQGSGARYALDNYNIVGDDVALANFEGNFMDNGFRERKQPYWDKGYTIDVFYVTYFCVVTMIIVKQLPHYTRKPNEPKKG